MATPVEIALNLTKQGDGATQAAAELTQAHDAALVLGDAALDAQRKQEKWNNTLQQLDTSGLEKLEAQLSEVIAETDRTGGSTAALKQRLDDVKAKLGETGDTIRRTAADYRDLDKGTKDAATQSGNLANTLVRQLAPAAAAMKLKSMAMEALTYAESIKDAGERTGLTADEVQRLTYAANQNATSFADLESGLKNLAVNIENNAGKLADLGIATKTAEGDTRSMRDVLGDFAELVKNTEDPTKRTALAVGFLGRSGQDLVPLLNQGRDGLKAFGDEAARAGRVIDEATIKKLDESKQRLEDFDQRVTIFTGNLAAAFMDFGEGMGMIAGDVLNAIQGLPSATSVVMDSTAGAQGKFVDLQAEIRAQLVETQAEFARYKRAAQEAFNNAQDDNANSVLDRANKKLAAEEEAKRTPEEKARRAVEQRQRQFGEEVAYFDRSPDPEARRRGRATLEQERDIDIAKINADAAAARAKLDAEAQEKADKAARDAERAAALSAIGKSAPEIQAGARYVGAQSRGNNQELNDAAKKLNDAAVAAQEGGTTAEEAAKLADAVGNLVRVMQKFKQDSSALRLTQERLQAQINELRN